MKRIPSRPRLPPSPPSPAEHKLAANAPATNDGLSPTSAPANLQHRSTSRETALRRQALAVLSAGASSDQSPPVVDPTGSEEAGDIEQAQPRGGKPLSRPGPGSAVANTATDSPSEVGSFTSTVSDLPTTSSPGPSDATPDEDGRSVAQCLLALARGTDLVQLLKHADTQEVLDQLRFGTPGDPSDPGLLNQLIGNVRTMRQDLLTTLAYEPHMSPKLGRALLEGLDNIQISLEGMQADPPAASRALTIAIVNVASAVLPMAVPLAANPRQTLFAAEMSAVVAKSLVEAAAMISLPWVDAPLMAERWKARYLVNNLQAVYFLATVFTDKPAQNTAYNVLGGMAAIVTLFGVFMARELRHGVTSLQGTHPYADHQKAGGSLGDETKASLASILGRVRAEQKSLEGAKTEFEETRNVNSLLSKRVSLAVDTYRTMASKMASALSEEYPPQHDDPDRIGKLALAVVTGIITTGGAVLIWPEKIGVADLGSDAAFATALQLSIAFDSTKSSADALDDFKTFSGFSIVLAMVLGASKLANDYLKQGPDGPLIGALVMTALNLTVPGPVGDLASRGLAQAGTAAGEFGKVCWEIGNNLYALLAVPPR